MFGYFVPLFPAIRYVIKLEILIILNKSIKKFFFCIFLNYCMFFLSLFYFLIVEVNVLLIFFSLVFLHFNRNLVN